MGVVVASVDESEYESEYEYEYRCAEYEYEGEGEGEGEGGMDCRGGQRRVEVGRMRSVISVISVFDSFSATPELRAW